MRNIAVSTDVFAALWQARREGEETEDAILRRILGMPEQASATPADGGRMGGFYDERTGVHFPEGMRIYRTYKGHRREAIASRDRWFVPATGQSFHSLHKLSQSIIASNENAWTAWKYRDLVTAEEHFIEHLRKAKEQSNPNSKS
jgi:hypothetical protein